MMLRNIVCLAVMLAVGCVALSASADAWDAPVSYYSSATGTGTTLKSQLLTAMSTGQIMRNYGDFRFSAAITDRDPNNPNNILLVYNRASVPATWDSGATWNREHTWPDSRGPGTYSNSSTGLKGDPHMIRPINPSINGSRGNDPYGLDNSSGTYGAVSGGYWFPGNADMGDMARTMFYHETRYGSSGISLTDSFPSGFQMGDLSSLLAWHYKDVPDEFERRRNHTIYSQAYNPSYYTNNRNAYVDRPEYVWSVYVDQQNDSQLTIVGGTPVGEGGSARNVELGRVFVGGAVPAAQSFTINKGGMDGTYFEVSTAGSATSSVTGRYNAFAMNATGTRSINVGLNTTTAAAGLKSGTVTVDNLDVTNQFGDGYGAQDDNDTFNVGLEVVDHATPSFAGLSELPSLVYDFGSVLQGSLDPSHAFDIFNLEETFGFTADLDFDSFLASGDTSSFLTDFPAAAGSLSILAGTSGALNVAFDTSLLGSYSATYNLSFSDEDLPGALTSGLSLTVTGQVVGSVVPEPASWVLLAMAACVLGLRRRNR